MTVYIIRTKLKTIIFSFIYTMNLFNNNNIDLGTVQEESEQGFPPFSPSHFLELQLKIYKYNNPTIKSSNNDILTLAQCNQYLIQEIIKMSDYDFEIAYQCCPEEAVLPNPKVYQKVVQFHYQCSCSHRWNLRFQNLSIRYRLERQEKQEKKDKRKKQEKESEQSESEMVEEPEEKEEKPLRVRYMWDIGAKKCEKCGNMVKGALYMRDLVIFVKRFCIQLTNKKNQEQESKEQKKKQKINPLIRLAERMSISGQQ